MANAASHTIRDKWVDVKVSGTLFCICNTYVHIWSETYILDKRKRKNNIAAIFAMCCKVSSKLAKMLGSFSAVSKPIFARTDYCRIICSIFSSSTRIAHFCAAADVNISCLSTFRYKINDFVRKCRIVRNCKECRIFGKERPVFFFHSEAHSPPGR